MQKSPALKCLPVTTRNHEVHLHRLGRHVITATRNSNEGGRGTGDSDRSIPFRKGGVAPVKNQNAFFDAFDIKDGDKMFLAPAKRVTVW